MATSIIEFRQASLGYGKHIVLRGVTFGITAGDYFGLVGPNGAGKTTILRAILGSLKPLAGTLILRPTGDRPLRFGYVPQRETIDNILPFTVEQVVMMGRYHQIGMFGRPRPADHDAVGRSIHQVDIGNLRRRHFRELSGGQKQRTLIARALASEPDVLILDEPTNGMDLSSRASILSLIDTLHRSGKLTVIMVSHLLDDVANHVHRLAIVEHDFFQVGDIDEVLTGPNLGSLYRMPVAVERIRGRAVILTGGHDEPS